MHPDNYSREKSKWIEEGWHTACAKKLRAVSHNDDELEDSEGT